MNQNSFPTCWIYNENDVNAVESPFAQWGWASRTTSATLLEAMRGYAVVIANSQTISFTGPVNTGNLSTAITFTPSVSTLSDGWNLIGNPYPSPISWNALRLIAGNTALNASVKRWKQTGSYAGQYSDWNGSVSVNGGNNEIAVGQGFLIKSALGGGPVNFTQAARLASSSGAFQDADPIAVPNNLLRMKVTGGTGADETVIYFDDNATDGFDENFDAIKMLSGTVGMPGIYSSASVQNGDMAINTLGAFNSNKEIPLNMYVDVNGSYNLSVLELNNFDPTAMVYMEDRTRGTFYNLRDVQEFTFNFTKGYVYQRFFIHFMLPVSTSATAETCNQNDGEITIGNPGGTAWNVALQTASGEVVSMLNGLGDSHLFANLPDGQYTLQFQLPSGYTVYKPVSVEAGMSLNSSFIASAESVNDGEEVQFTADQPVAGATYLWNFGDQTSISAGQVVQHTFDAPGIYNVSLTLTGGSCSSTTERTVSVLATSTPTGIANAANDQYFGVYPNPANTVLTIELKNASAKSPEWMEIQDAAGRTISREVVKDLPAGGRKTITVSNLANGVYQLVLGTKDARFTRAFVIAH